MEQVDAHTPHDYDWIKADHLLPIAHGLGPKLYGGDNTLKTLEMGFERGFRVFEVDLSLTADNHLVCYHGGEERDIDAITYADYRRIVLREGKSPCHFSDIVHYARLHPEVRFILDVKNRFYDAYTIIRREIGDKKLGKSFIPQIYDFEQLPSIRKGNFFAGEIFTSYRSSLTTTQMFSTAQKYDVRVLTLTLPRFFELKGRTHEPLSIFTHPVNDPFVAAEVRKYGARGIYTSYLTPATIPEVFHRTGTE